MRAKAEALDALHALIAETLIDEITPVTVEGKRVGPSPQMIAQAIKFLKDNGIDAPAKSERMSNLAAALEGFDLDLDETALRPN